MLDEVEIKDIKYLFNKFEDDLKKNDFDRFFDECNKRIVPIGTFFIDELGMNFEKLIERYPDLLDIQACFKNCENLKNASIRNFDRLEIQSIFFFGCEKLEEFYSDAEYIKVLPNGFSGCTPYLLKINIPNCKEIDFGENYFIATVGTTFICKPECKIITLSNDYKRKDI